MADPKPTGSEDNLSEEQRKFLEAKQQQRQEAAVVGEAFRSDRGEYLKSARQKKVADKAAKRAARPQSEPVTRREFLNYAWGAAMGVILAETGIASFMFALPRFKEGEFGGTFSEGTVSNMPSVGATPRQNLDGAFWLVNDDDGVRALYRVCTHLGCLYEWKDQTQRFECPCHGSKFQHNGQYIEGPAPRSLDQFVVRVEQGGQVVAETMLDPNGKAILPVPVTADLADAEVVVDTGTKLKGPSHG